MAGFDDVSGPPSPRRNNSTSHVRDLGLISFGGLDLEGRSSDLWILAFDTAPPPRGAGGDASPRSLIVSPNPARGSVTLEFALPRGGDARLEIHDLAGRRIMPPSRTGSRPAPTSCAGTAVTAHGRVSAVMYFCSVITDGHPVSSAE